MSDRCWSRNPILSPVLDWLEAGRQPFTGSRKTGCGVDDLGHPEKASAYELSNSNACGSPRTLDPVSKNQGVASSMLAWATT
jgi:hypothetical protein